MSTLTNIQKCTQVNPSRTRVYVLSFGCVTVDLPSFWLIACKMMSLDAYMCDTKYYYGYQL